MIFWSRFAGKKTQHFQCFHFVRIPQRTVSCKLELFISLFKQAKRVSDSQLSCHARAFLTRERWCLLPYMYVSFCLSHAFILCSLYPSYTYTTHSCPNGYSGERCKFKTRTQPSKYIYRVKGRYIWPLNPFLLSCYFVVV